MLTLLFAAALAFPVPSSRPIPVTEPLLNRPPERQSGVRVASNGTIALAVWNDERSNGLDVTATRVNAGGMPLDPTGIVIQSNASLTDVFWTGSSFAVITLPYAPPVPFPAATAATSYDYMISYVGSDGTVTQPAPLASYRMRYATHSGEGAGTRVLFLPPDGFSRLGLLVDLQGKVIHQGAIDDGYASVLAASNGSGFLVLRSFPQNGGSLAAETLDRDGNWLDSNDPHLPAAFSPAALAADGHGGYALFGYVSQTRLVLVRLDANGIAAAPPQDLQAVDPSSWLPAVTATTTATGFAATWNAAAANNHTDTYVSRDGGTPEKRFDWTGFGWDAAYEPLNDLVLTSIDDTFTTEADVFVQKGHAQPVPLTYSANYQTYPAVAGGANGFVAAWSENSGSDARIYVRRYASDATPLDTARIATSAPITDEISPSLGRASVTASGGAYLIAWDQTLARRMDARTGGWLDGVPFELHATAAASNGSDALALTLEKCPDSPCMMARRVAMTGGATVSPGVELSDRPIVEPAIASDGTNYLASWGDVQGLVVMRLRPDGSPIDAAPIVLDPQASIPAVAWNGKTYFVTWTSLYQNQISGAYVGADGAVQRLGVITSLPAITAPLKTVAYDGTFLIFSRHALPGARFFWPDEWSITLLDGSTTTLEIPPSASYNFIDAASDGTHLILAYPRIDAQAGRVSRVFLDPRVFPSRKRAFR